MTFYSTGEAAKKIGISLITLKRYIASKKIPLPPARVAGVRVRLWSEEDIAQVKDLLPKIGNGRKTRWQRQRKKKNGAPAGVPVPHEKNRPKRKGNK